MSQLSDDLLAFIESKSLSENSQKSYFYDLQQFCQLVEDEISPSKLKLYQQSLLPLTVTSRKRKISAVNQFLLYLYDQGRLPTYYRLKNRDKLRQKSQAAALLDLSDFDRARESAGKWIALLILELGLSPSEIAGIKRTDYDPNFGVLSLKKDQQVRILPLPQNLRGLFAQTDEAGTYLFDHQGQAYSRQWFFNQLSSFLNEVGHGDLSAQKLREQFILREIERGTALLDLTKKLGLKTPLTLEHYYKNGY